MAGCANGRLPRSRNSVPVEPSRVVPQERLRHQAAEFLPNMTRGAVAALEVRLVTLETNGHRRRTDRCHLGIDDSAVAENTLTVDLLLHQVSVMREQDALGPLGGGAGKAQ